MATATSLRIDSAGEHWTDSSESYSSDEESRLLSAVPPWACTIQHQRGQPYILTGNPALLDYLSGCISKVWKQVGRHLQIKECIMENIEIDYERENAREKAYQLLLTWTRNFGREATLDRLLDVLVYIGREDIANMISESNRRQRCSVVSERALRVEKKSHEKLQKQVLRQLKQAMAFFEERLTKLEYYQHQVYKGREAQMLKQELLELDKNIIEEKLDSLKEQICQIGEKEHKYFPLDQQLRSVADKLYQLDLMFKKFNETFEDMRVVDIECKFVGCHYRKRRFAPCNSSGKRDRIPSKADEDEDDEVFEDPADHKSSSKNRFSRNTQSRSSLSKLFHARKKPSLPYHQGQEEHTNRKLRVPIDDTEEQFQMEDFLNKFCRRYRPDRPFVYSHCCINRGLQGSRGDITQRLCPLSTLDPDTLPNPCYQSTETIMSLVTSPHGRHMPKGSMSESSVWI